MSELILRKLNGIPYWGRTDEYEVIETEPDTIAHVVYSIVAATLAAPILKALHNHIEYCPKCHETGWSSECSDGLSLYDLISSKGSIVIG